MSEAATEIPWGEFGEAWWRDAAKTAHASDRQMLFAVFRFSDRKVTRTKAAELAGYTGDMKKRGSDAASTTAVMTLLTMAEARKVNNGAEPRLVTREDLRRRLSDLVKSPDPGVSLRASVEYQKMLDAAEPMSLLGCGDGFDDWRVVRDALRAPCGGPGIALFHFGQSRELAGIPLLHDVAAAVQRDAPPVWDWLLSQQSRAGRAMLENYLADPEWQFEARRKLWREIGIEIEAPALQVGGDNQQHAAA